MVFGWATRTIGNEESLSTKVAAGAISGIAMSFVISPVELVRNRLMVQTYDGKASRAYAGPLDAVKQIVRRDGVQGMWRGIVPAVLRDGPGCAAWFGTFHALRSYDVPLIIAGGMAGISYWLVALPFDSLKSRIQTSNSAASSTPHLYRNLYSGLGISIMRGFPSSAIIFTVQDVVYNRIL